MSPIALEVGELVSYLRMDDTDFQRKLSRGGTDLQRFGQGAQRMLQPIAKGFAAGTTALGVFAGALISQGAAYNSLQQSSRAALTTILGGAEQANEQMDKLDDFARNSPFAKQVFIKAQQQMLAFGVETEKVIPYLGAIQDGVAAMGGSNQEISEIAFIMSQISAAGKITGQDLMQFGQRGVNAAKLIGDQMGLTEVEVRESITAGTLDAGEALDNLAAGMQETYDGAAANVKKTWDGAVDRVKAATRDIGALLASPFIDPNGGGKALDWANALADLLRSVEDQAGPLIEVLLPKLIPLADGITNRLEAAAAAVDSLDMDQLLAQLSGVSEYAAPLAAVAAALFAMGTQAAPIQALGLSLNPVAAALVAIIAASPDARGAVMELLSSFSELRDEAGDLLLAVGDLGNVLIDGLVQILSAVTGNAGEAGGAIDLLALGIDGMTSAVKLVTGIAEPLLGFLAGLVDAASGAEGPILGVVAALVLMRTVDVGGVITKLTSALSAGKTTWGASQATLEALGREAGLMNTSMMTARAGVTALGGALKGLLVANAPLLAISALAAVIGHYMQEAAEAKALTDDLANSFDELTGAATAKTDRLILDQMNESLTAGDWEVLREMGYDYNAIIEAVKAGGPELEALEKQLDRTTEAGRLRSIQTGETIDVTEAEAEASRRLKGELKDLGPAYQDAIAEGEEQQRQLEATGQAAELTADQMSGAARDAKLLEDALGVLSDEASSADEKLRALKEALDLIAGGTRSAEDAAFAYADNVRETTDAVADLAYEQEQLDEILNDDGSLNVQSEAASELRDHFSGLTDDAHDWALALAEVGDEQGVRDVYDGLYEDIQAVAEAANLGAEETNALMLSLGILPPEVMTDLVVNGEDAELATLRVGDMLNDLPAEVVSAIYGDTSGLDSSVEHTTLSLAYVAGLSADPMIGANDQENIEIVGAAVARLNELDGMEPTPEIQAEKRLLEGVVAGAKIDLDSIPDKTAQVIAETYGFSSVEALRREIERLRSRNIRINTQFVTTGRRPSTSGTGPRVATIDKNGSVHLPKGKRYADGGVEHRVAQIAPAGAWRVWAEEETGGEAYVPLAAHKRARSLAIMHDVAARFGHVMVPVQAKRFADGGTSTPPNQQQAVRAPFDYSRLEAAVSAGAERGTSRAQITFTGRGAAQVYGQGRSGSRTYGGSR